MGATGTTDTSSEFTMSRTANIEHTIQPPAPAGPPDPPPTLLGTLVLDVLRGRPRLTLTVHCPACRGLHHHGWGFDPGTPGQYPDGPTHREPHCWRTSSPYRRPHGRGYYVGPALSDENERTLRRYARLARECDKPAAPLVAPPAAGVARWPECVGEPRSGGERPAAGVAGPSRRIVATGTTRGIMTGCDCLACSEDRYAPAEV